MVFGHSKDLPFNILSKEPMSVKIRNEVVIKMWPANENFEHHMMVFTLARFIVTLCQKIIKPKNDTLSTKNYHLLR